ncbi:hypothetical protein D770_05210 [Flammeovirgaceae bacterium 311]|nr:hypothetical protein D770_05210 [Flammeovirgaceae bacterium 311]
MNLEKIHIDLPNHWAIGGESMWAEPLGNDLYKIENVPFYAYGLNYQDIVRATPEPDEQIPEIRELIESGGHRTFRILFKKEVDKEQQEKILDSFRELHVTYERANKTYVALDMKPEGDYQSIFDKLDEYEKQNVLGFETCEARIERSFDDSPEEV